MIMTTKWISSIVTTIWNDWLNLFFPQLCITCNELLVHGEKHVCCRCLSELPICSDAISRFHEVAPQIETLYYPILSHCHAWLSYKKGGHVQRIIYAIKYYDNKALGEQMGIMAGEWLMTTQPDLCRSIDQIVPIPLHPKKFRQRGYNQAEEIARGIAKVLCRPVINDAIIRNRHINSQTRKEHYERHESIKDSFSLKKSHLLIGRHILLIDDVITSGATLSQCLEALKNIPNIRIDAFALSAP